jgi:hypothetical protein
MATSSHIDLTISDVAVYLELQLLLTELTAGRGHHFVHSVVGLI